MIILLRSADVLTWSQGRCRMLEFAKSEATGEGITNSPSWVRRGCLSFRGHLPTGILGVCSGPQTKEEIPSGDEVLTELLEGLG